MTEKDAKDALRGQGITNPSKALIENWLRAQHYEESASPPPAPRETVRDMQPCISPSLSLADASSVARPSSASSLEPMLRERGQLQRDHSRKPGRPRILAPWFEAVATVMSDGTPLRQALGTVGIHGLTERQIRSLYRNRAFQALYQETRRKWWAEVGVRHRRPTVRPKGCKGADCLGLSRELLRSL